MFPFHFENEQKIFPRNIVFFLQYPKFKPKTNLELKSTNDEQ